MKTVMLMVSIGLILTTASRKIQAQSAFQGFLWDAGKIIVKEVASAVLSNYFDDNKITNDEKKELEIKIAELENKITEIERKKDYPAENELLLLKNSVVTLRNMSNTASQSNGAPQNLSQVSNLLSNNYTSVSNIIDKLPISPAGALKGIFTIYNELGERQTFQNIDVYLNDRLAGNITVTGFKPKSSLSLVGSGSYNYELVINTVYTDLLNQVKTSNITSRGFIRINSGDELMVAQTQNGIQLIVKK